MAIGLLPATVLSLLSGGHWTTREWLQTTAAAAKGQEPNAQLQRSTSSTAAYAEGLAKLIGPVTHLSLIDVSDGHVIEGAKDGRALSAAGIELQCLIVSDTFIGVSRVARQKRVQSFFQAELTAGSVHALAMRCWTPDEWRSNGAPRTYAEAKAKAKAALAHAAPRLPPRAGAPQMFRMTSSEQDVYGFEEVVLPPLPSGERLLIRESEERAASDSPDGEQSEDAILWRKMERYVSRHEQDDPGPEGVGGEIWPAAAALCAWLRERPAELRGASVLELGAGTGACGIYAAALGASRVVLTDGGPAALLDLARSNIAANRHLMADGASVEVRPLAWGEQDEAGETAPAHHNSHHMDQIMDLVADLVLASDVIYGHESGLDARAEASHAALARTIGSLLRRGDGGAGMANSHPRGGRTGWRPPRVILAHEHRSRAPSTLGAALSRWDEDDEHLASFEAAVASEGLRLRRLWSARPTMRVRGLFRSWSADVSIAEVLLGAP